MTQRLICQATIHLQLFLLNVLFSARNSNNKSVLCEVKINIETLSPQSSTKVDILNLGEVGTFDEDGVMASDVFKNNGTEYITYIGWNRGVSVPFRNAIGLVRYTNGVVEKISSGPILDRSIYDPCFVASNCVITKENKFIMYYLSCLKWDYVNGKFTHFYNIKIAESENGINWIPTGKLAIDFKDSGEYAISVPRVIKDDKLYRMWYSYRGSHDAPTYRIGYAESSDGFSWTRKDKLVTLEPSESGWDSEMICYPFIFEMNGNTYMLYNGNVYVKTLFGIAILEK